MRRLRLQLASLISSRNGSDGCRLLQAADMMKQLHDEQSWLRLRLRSAGTRCD
jgi:hypothetical protein